MNLRILKKLSKRAAVLLPHVNGWHRAEAFIAERDAYTGSAGHDRKHWSRSRAVHSDSISESIVIRPRNPGRYPFIHLREPSHPWPGTPMIGWSSGYETPEWEERTAWEELVEIAYAHNTTYACIESADGEPEYVTTITRKMPNPSAILRWATPTEAK